MKNKKRGKRRIIIGCALISLALFGFILYQIITTYKAHATFEGYCKWRGLVVVNKSADYGYCKNEISGEEFKMVLVKGRWYLDGDLPNNWPF